MDISYKVIITSLAKADLGEISQYLSVKLLVPSAAERIIGKIYHRIKHLQLFPKGSQIIELDGIDSGELRSIRVEGYRIIYRVVEAEKRVEIVRVIFGARDLRKVLEYKV